MTYDSVPHSAIEVKLDGLPVEIPAERQTLGGICSYLESVALHQQRILCSLAVDGGGVDKECRRRQAIVVVRKAARMLVTAGKLGHEVAECLEHQ